MLDIPSPAIAVVGRHNSGKTTLVCKLIEELVTRGHDIGSVKHHHKTGFEFDIPGKDSYRHRQAGASETVIAAPGQIAIVKTVEGERECADIVRRMPGHELVIVEGYRKSGLPTIEVMRAGNAADAATAEAFARGALDGAPLGTDFTQLSRGDRAFEFENPTLASDVAQKMPTADTVAVVTDIPQAVHAADQYGIPAFGLDDVEELSDFLEKHFLRPRVTVVIQAGGESKRMGRSKATVPFDGRPLICRLVERLSPAADELIVTTNEPENLAFLDEQYPHLGIKLVRDEFDFRGALPGMYTALNAASNPYVAMVACDMVFASAKLVVAEAIELKETGADAVVPVNKHGYEPFHAIYRKSVCLPAVAEGIERGETRAQCLFSRVNVREFSQEQVLAAEPMGGCFVNANTPGELKALEDGFMR
ncbi:MAG: molybdopterin-guanine dinucleotide biosynthesis protein B [Eggerthellaceae bacterium]|nr:molybdopterin-guanine dinucleotide biosynthesis protein B [Eggerthellaceae bacterium]